jgi:pilus assembly protein Flp/PilA
MPRFFATFLRDDDAATSVEYAVMLALIIATIFGSIALVGTNNGALWNNISNSVSAVSS